MQLIIDKTLKMSEMEILMMGKASKKIKFVTPDTKIVGENLKTLRLRAGVSQQEIAGFLGVTSQQVQKYESGRNRLSAERLFMLKQFHNVPYEQFFVGLSDGVTWKSKALPMPDSIATDVYRLMIRLNDAALKNKIRKIVYILSR